MREQKEERGKIETDIIRDWLSREDPITIATHMRVDADAAFSAALLHALRPHATVVFVRADCSIDEHNCIGVDLLEGERSVKGLRPGSAFGKVIEVLKDIDPGTSRALGKWAKQLNLTDSGKPCRDRVVLAEIVSCWRNSGLDDRSIVGRAGEMIRGKIEGQRRCEENARKSKSIPIIRGVAVISKGMHSTVRAMEKRGALAVVRESHMGMAINLTRKAQRNEHDLNEISDSLPEGWFIHPDGFIACFGSPKAPKDPRESGIDLQSLTLLVSNWLEELRHSIETSIPGPDGISVIGPNLSRVRSNELFQKGAIAVVRESEIGQCIIISRSAQKSGLSLSELSDSLPEGWFVHDGGFIASFGGVKSPRDPVDSGISLMELEGLVRNLIESHNFNENTPRET